MAPESPHERFDGLARLRRPGHVVSRRAALVLALCALAFAAWLGLDAPLTGLVPNEGGWRTARAFFAGALSPAFDYEKPDPRYTPFLVTVLESAWRTVMLAAAGMSVSLVIGCVLGVLGSEVWWRGLGRRLGFASRAAHTSLRVVIALMRSVHELVWAILFLAAFDLSVFSAVLALAIPYGGTLAKVFGEMLDEEPRAPAEALLALGASRASIFALGIVPGVMPNLLAYGFYRFECALRSAAVMGFFGLPTIGLSLSLAWGESHYREVWTYLYALTALVLVFELWSSVLRRRFVA
jgi:phosphonate transport system permease protein